MFMEIFENILMQGSFFNENQRRYFSGHLNWMKWIFFQSEKTLYIHKLYYLTKTNFMIR